MTKRLFDIISMQRLRQLADNPGPNDAFGLLARSVVMVLDNRGQEDAEAAFLQWLPDYFHNVSAMHKRRYADALAAAFCASKHDFDEFWEHLKKSGVTGRTTTR
jgi:hypothetical protein